MNIDIEKYGRENFSRVDLEICENESVMRKRECYWIETLDSRNPNVGYNILKGGQGFTSEDQKIMWSNKTQEERSAIAHRRYENSTPEDRSEKTKKGQETLGREGRSASAYKMVKTLGPEGLSARSKKAMETMGPEGLSKRAKKAYQTRRNKKI